MWSKIRIVLIALLLLTPSLRASAPLIESTGMPDKPFRVTFDAGAITVTTTFVADNETIEIGGKTVPYAPSHTWLLSPKVTQITDDWDFIDKNGDWWTITAEVQYEAPGFSRLIKSNSIRVKH